VIRQPPPLRFLAVAVGGWFGVRAAMLAPHWWAQPVVAAPAPLVRARAGAAAPSPSPHERFFAGRSAGRRAPEPPAPGSGSARPALLPAATPAQSPGGGAPTQVAATAAALVLQAPVTPQQAAPAGPASGARPLLIPQLVPPPRAERGRWSGSAWLLLREEGAGPLAPAGTLGGAQAGGRLAFRLNRDEARPLSISARLYAPLHRPQGAEAAIGVDWRPSPHMPVNLLVERRQRLGREGHSAFAATVHGGVSGREVGGGFRLDAYGQAGVVGLSGRRPFVDGAATLTLPVGGVSAGAGLWGGAQPDAARLDLGPVVAMPVRGTPLRVSAQWRFRVAGESSPGSGPALTVGADF
jgi:hypothetical protein